MNGNAEIIRLLEQISIKLTILTQKETIPQISTQKNLSFLFDKVNSNWLSFEPIQQNNMRLFAYHYASAPDPKLAEINEGWSPLRIDIDGKLLTV